MIIWMTYCVEKFGEFGNVVPPARASHLKIIKSQYNIIIYNEYH